jgi:hypothetical protein
MMLSLFSSWIQTQSCISIPLDRTLKCYPYEQLSAMCRLKLYAMFLNVQIILPFIEIGLLYRGSQQWLSCIVVVRFTGGGNRSTGEKNINFFRYVQHWHPDNLNVFAMKKITEPKQDNQNRLRSLQCGLSGSEKNP